MRKPKILLICDVKTWGGWERAVKIKEHLSDEFDFDMMDSEEFSDFEQKSDSHFLHIDEVNAIAHRSSRHFTKKHIILPELMKYKKLKRSLDRDYDLYYLMFHTMLCSQQVKRVIYGGGRFISAITGLPVVKKVFFNEKYAQGLPAFQFLAKASAGFVVNNLIAKEELNKIYDGPKFYTPRGVDPELFYPDCKPEKWDKKVLECLFVGKRDSGKGLRFLRSVVEEAGGTLRENQRNYTNALTKDQMRGFYNDGHVLLVASTTDGTPNPALEAAACGIPVIANRIGNMPEFMKDGKNGFFVDKGSTGAQRTEYVNKLKWMRKNRDKLQEMGENARQTVLDGWTWKHSMEYERKALRGILKAEGKL